MSARRLLVLAACAAAPLAAVLAAAPARAAVSIVGIQAIQTSAAGKCPATISVRARVLLDAKGRFTYRWERSDGSVDGAVHAPADADGVNPTVVGTTWTLGAASPAFHPFNGWMKLHVLTPADVTSDAATFTLDCGAPGAAPTPAPTPKPTAAATPTPAATNGCTGAPDLVALLHTPMDGWLAVKNAGTGNAATSRLVLRCRKANWTGTGTGCPDPPASVAAPFYKTSGWIGVTVPALACGATFEAPMPWWGAVAFAPGTYSFDATADVGNTVAESNEGNNFAVSTLVK